MQLSIPLQRCGGLCGTRRWAAPREPAQPLGQTQPWDGAPHPRADPESGHREQQGPDPLWGPVPSGISGATAPHSGSSCPIPTLD